VTARTVVVLLNRDLRVTDHPALSGSLERAVRVVPLFVLDPVILRRASPNRSRFLVECLADLRTSLQSRGGNLFIRQGNTVAEAMDVARATKASHIMTTADVSAFARRRQCRLEAACAATDISLELLPGLTIVPPGQLQPSGGGGHFRVFTPYWRKWEAARWRPVSATPDEIPAPSGLDPGELPTWNDLVSGACSPHVVPGGERAAQARVGEWLAAVETSQSTSEWDTSRLSAYLRFGCTSPLDLARTVLASRWDGAAEFVRQLCWRDFFHQVVADFPAITRLDYRPRRNVSWRSDPAALNAWMEGETGVPLVDAAMTQLLDEGWMPNRGRLVAASYLTKTLGVDWRLGAAHFDAWLVDADVPNNYGNWQWVAGTGNDTRPNRVLNPAAQARRFDPNGDYVSRWNTDASRTATQRT
jgi:deoxyribodipyrimidine photo-lyase